MQTDPIPLHINVEPAESSPPNTRLYLPPDQKIYLSIARFLQSSPLFGTQMFRLDAHRGTMRVDLWDAESQSVLHSVSYLYRAADDAEIAALEAAISKDFANPSAGV